MAMYTALPSILNSIRPLAIGLTLAVIVTLLSTELAVTPIVVFFSSVEISFTVNETSVEAILKLSSP